jgi:hypothetical protein
MAIIKSFFTRKEVSEAEVLGTEREAKEYLDAVIDYLKCEPEEVEALFRRVLSEQLTPRQKMARNAILKERRLRNE